MPLGTQEGSGKGACLCQETGRERHVCATGFVSDQKPSATEDLVKVACNRLGRMRLPLDQILSLTTEFKYSPSQCGKGHVCAIGYVSDQKSSAPEDLVKVPEDLVRVT